jgi:predicted anti-sigma-YlaC factor YlaD
VLIPVPSPTECTTAREAVSLRLDDVLSELGAARLDQHLGGCADCEAYAAEVAAATGLLRAATLEQPEGPAFALRPRRVRLGGLQAAAAAVALVAVAAGSSFALGRTLGAPGPGARAVTGPAEILSLQADTTNQHLLAMLRRLAPNATLNTGKAIAL